MIGVNPNAGLAEAQPLQYGRGRIRWYSREDEDYEALSEESAKDMRQFEKDFCIAMRVAARTSKSDQETALLHAEESFIPTSSRKIDRIARTLPDDVLGIIFDKFYVSFQKRKMKQVMKELLSVTSFIRYGFCGKQHCNCCKRIFRHKKHEGGKMILSWTYLDENRDSALAAVHIWDPMFDYYSSDDSSDDGED